MATGRLPQMEYFLQGSVSKESVENLLGRLEGLCDNTSHERDKYSDHETVYTMRKWILILDLSRLFKVYIFVFDQEITVLLWY